MKVILVVAILFSFANAGCTYNNINKFVGESGDNLLLLGQYGENNNKPCEFNTVIKSKHIESFSYKHNRGIIIINMMSGNKYILTKQATSFEDLVEVFKNN